ncbi:MAG: hypothetical protein GX556_15995 [Fibrobacter sp.]|nr:hypothetical protein [Fibrobacter sp.]
MKKILVLCVLISHVIIGQDTYTARTEGFSSIIKDIKSKYKYLLIYNVNLYQNSYSSGVSVEIEYRSTSDKVIKYIDFYLTPYNEVGDSVNCSITHLTSKNLRVTGPLQPFNFNAYNQENNVSAWKNVWYNSTISCVKLNKIVITFIDNTKVILIKNIANTLGDGVKNNCSYHPD